MRAAAAGLCLLSACSAEPQYLGEGKLYQLALTQDTAPALQTDDGALYIVETHAWLPVRTPSAAERAALNGASPPYARHPWVMRDDIPIQVDFSLTNLDDTKHDIDVILNGLVGRTIALFHCAPYSNPAAPCGGTIALFHCAPYSNPAAPCGGYRLGRASGSHRVCSGTCSLQSLLDALCRADRVGRPSTTSNTSTSAVSRGAIDVYADLTCCRDARSRLNFPLQVAPVLGSSDRNDRGIASSCRRTCSHDSVYKSCEAWRTDRPGVRASQPIEKTAFYRCRQKTKRRVFRKRSRSLRKACVLSEPFDGSSV